MLQLLEDSDDAPSRAPGLAGAEVLRVDTTYASPAMRDGFLTALDRDDALAVLRIARNLTGCLNPLPSSTCLELGLPVGSTYGAAARSVIAR